MSPDSVVRFGSASVRTRPRCSSALISTSIVVPPAIMRPSMKPNGDTPESTPAATSPTGMLVGPVGAVIGRRSAGCREPILAVMRLLNTFHCTPSSRPAWREASTKRTSSMTCCGDDTMTVLMISGANWRAMVTARSSVTASGASPDSMMRPLTDDTLMPGPATLVTSVARRDTS